MKSRKRCRRDRERAIAIARRARQGSSGSVHRIIVCERMTVKARSIAILQNVLFTGAYQEYGQSQQRRKVLSCIFATTFHLENNIVVIVSISGESVLPPCICNIGDESVELWRASEKARKTYRVLLT